MGESGTLKALVFLRAGVPVTENKSDAVSKDKMSLTGKEEAAILAKIKADYDPVAAEAELRELLAQRERGELISADEFMAELFGKDWEKELA
jgi:hypothetical protein